MILPNFRRPPIGDVVLGTWDETQLGLAAATVTAAGIKTQPIDISGFNSFSLFVTHTGGNLTLGAIVLAPDDQTEIMQIVFASAVAAGTRHQFMGGTASPFVCTGIKLAFLSANTSTVTARLFGRSD